MADNIKKLGSFLQEVANWDWKEFVEAEHDNQFTSNQAVIFALVRACAMQKMDAIRMSLNRLDGKLKTPVQFEYPHIFYIYPNATISESTDSDTRIESSIVADTSIDEVIEGEVIPAEEPEPLTEADLPSLSLRETVDKMSDYPQDVPETIIDAAVQTEQAMRDEAAYPETIPKVKSVIAAHLLTLAQGRDIGAVGEVFDQIDGKLVETIQFGDGQPLYITYYSKEAPLGAYLNKDGVVEIEATVATNIWAEKLAKGMKLS